MINPIIKGLNPISTMNRIKIKNRTKKRTIKTRDKIENKKNIANKTNITTTKKKNKRQVILNVNIRRLLRRKTKEQKIKADLKSNYYIKFIILFYFNFLCISRMNNSERFTFRNHHKKLNSK